MKRLYFILLFFTCSSYGFSQAEVALLGFDFSAMFRDSIGRATPFKPVTLRFTLLDGQTGSPSTSPWVEVHNTTTDAYGFATVVVGNGTKEAGSAGSFADVDFSGTPYWLLVEVLNLKKQFAAFAKQPLQAVAYAKVAENVQGGSLLPPGTISSFAGDTSHIPAGWLFCDGRIVSKTDERYKNLFNAIGYSWGTGGLYTPGDLFNIPIVTGFLRGAYSLGYDPDAEWRTTSNYGSNRGNNVGSSQADAVKYHRHQVLTTPGNTSSTLKNVATDYRNNNTINYSTRTGTGDKNFAAESRPKNAYVTYIVKL